MSDKPATTTLGVPWWFVVPVLAGASLVLGYFGLLLVLNPAGALSIAMLGWAPLMVVTLLRWADIQQVTSRSLYPWAMLLGGGISALFALVFNSLVGVALGETFVIVLGAPLVEELVKACSVLFLLRIRGAAFDPLTGAAMGALVGAGFAFSEDLSYALSSTDPLSQTFVRLVFGPFFHASTAAIVGAAAASRTRRPLGTAVFVGVVLHIGWNTFSQMGLTLTGALVMSFVLSAGFGLGWWLLRGELRDQLAEGTPAGREQGWLLDVESRLLAEPSWRTKLATRHPDHEHLLMQWHRSAITAVLAPSEDHVELLRSHRLALRDAIVAERDMFSGRGTGDQQEQLQGDGLTRVGADAWIDHPLLAGFAAGDIQQVGSSSGDVDSIDEHTDSNADNKPCDSAHNSSLGGPEDDS